MSFGRVERTARHWHVICEPHVRARLKRVFPRAPGEARNAIELLATPENSRELLWFLQRYPMDVPQLGALEDLSREHVDMELRLADLLAGRGEPRSYTLARPAREYQEYAATFLDVRKGLLLGDDVGLGKTVTAMLPMTDSANLIAVVVRPAYMPGHWEGKLAEFLPDLRVHTVNRGYPYPLVRQPRQRRPDLWDTLPDVIVISYHMLRGWTETLGELAHYVVLDEVQQLRHEATGVYRAARYLLDRAPLRMGLSATPIYNYGAEFFPVIDALLPGALGDRDEFIREWCLPGDFGEKAKLSNPDTFGAYLRREGIMLRRTRRDVGRELPPVQKIVHEVETDEKLLDKLTGDAVAMARVVLASTEHYRGERMQASGRFEAIMRQATGLAKAPFVAEFVRLLVESGEKVLLYGWHHGVYEIWRERLAGVGVVFYTGAESAAQKLEAKRRFVDPGGDASVLVMSLRSGAGVDGLQDVCRVCVFGELDWSPGVHTQCVGRVDRDGMDMSQGVLAYFLTSDEGCDPIMLDVLGVKREQIEGVNNPGEGQLERADVGEHALRQLARQVLEARGVSLPDPQSDVLPFPTRSSVDPPVSEAR